MRREAAFGAKHRLVQERVCAKKVGTKRGDGLCEEKKGLCEELSLCEEKKWQDPVRSWPRNVSGGRSTYGWRFTGPLLGGRLLGGGSRAPTELLRVSGERAAGECKGDERLPAPPQHTHTQHTRGEVGEPGGRFKRLMLDR